MSHDESWGAMLPATNQKSEPCFASGAPAASASKAWTNPIRGAAWGLKPVLRTLFPSFLQEQTRLLPSPPTSLPGHSALPSVSRQPNGPTEARLNYPSMQNCALTTNTGKMQITIFWQPSQRRSSPISPRAGFGDLTMA